MERGSHGNLCEHMSQCEVFLSLASNIYLKSHKSMLPMV